MQRERYKWSTVNSATKALKALAKRTNLLNPETVKAYVASSNVTENRKQTVLEHVARFYNWKGIKWNKPKWRRIETLPFIPTEMEVDQLISGLDPKRAAFTQLIKETAARPGEAWAIKWIDVDKERSYIRIQSPEKNSRPRERKASTRLLAMLDRLPHGWDYLFHQPGLEPVKSLDDFRRTFIHQRNAIAEKLQNPRIKQITFKTLRHFKATMEYHRTKDILYVMQMLGHKSIKNTLIYTHLISFETDEFTCKTATNVDEATKLIEAGFEYVIEMGGCETVQETEMRLAYKQFCTGADNLQFTKRFSRAARLDLGYLNH